jgi:Tfp pilus assembly protein PilX
MNTKSSYRQKGVVTTFTGVMILVLLTLMMFFAMRVGILDQRVSANENRQKQAFHAAESGVQHAKEYFKANSVLAASPIPGLLSDGTDGWLAEGRWTPCSDADLTDTSHPCRAEPDEGLRPSLYFWNWADANTGNVADPTMLPLNTETLLPAADENVEVHALLCLLEIDLEQETPVQGCSTNTTDNTLGNFVDGTRYMITLVSRGEVDCDANGDNCAQAVIREMVSNFGGTAGGQAPAVPLTTKNMFPPSGAAEVVANPNGGGIGVPTSVWMNRNPSCTPDGSAIDPSQGSWATCEAHEWYETESIPDDVECPGSCSCAFQESLSYTHGSDDILGIDLIEDEEFPCDLFQFYFGTPRDNYESVKSFAKVLEDCDSLGPWSSGIYWISGPDCDVNSNAVIGSAEAPVLLISAASVTRMAGGATIFGILYVSDVEDIGASFESQGNNIVYGQVILDAQFGSYNGTFQVVYNENLLVRANGTGGLGNVIGGWSDFHDDDWQYQ